MKLTFIFSTILSLSVTTASAQLIYSNTGDNTTGFSTMYDPGGSATTMVSNGTNIVESNGGIWDMLPVTVSGDFQISFDVNNNSFDGDSHFLLVDDSSNGGLDMRNSPQGTDTPSINIFSGTDFTNYNQFFFPTVGATLATATTTNFPNQTWTHITITKTGNILTDNVGGQIIQANVSSVGLSSTLRVGLGAYATTFNGGAGTLSYRNITVVATPEPPAIYLLGVAFLLGICGFIFNRVRRPAL
jgi:hypothetical protein